MGLRTTPRTASLNCVAAAPWQGGPGAAEDRAECGAGQKISHPPCPSPSGLSTLGRPPLTLSTRKSPPLSHPKSRS